MKFMHALFGGLAAVLMSVAAAGAPSASTSRVLDDFSTMDAWQAQASDGVRSAAGAADQGLRLDFDFAGKGGYAFVRRALPLDLPENYEISFYVRADAPVNHFEFKLTDASGDNVWWFPQQNYTFPKEWQLVRIKKRQMLFAWGPTKERVLKHADRIEFVVSAGSNLFARLKRRTPMVTQVPGLLILVPGSIGLRSMQSLLGQDVEMGIATAFRVAIIGISLAAGLLAGNVVTTAVNRIRR